MQVFPPTSTPQGPVTHQRKESSRIEKCAHAADGPHTGSTYSSWTGARRCKSILSFLLTPSL